MVSKNFLGLPVPATTERASFWNFYLQINFLTWHWSYHTAQKMKFSIKDFFKCEQIRIFLRIWSHLLKKSLMENFIFCRCRFVIIIFFCNNYLQLLYLVLRCPRLPFCHCWGKDLPVSMLITEFWFWTQPENQREPRNATVFRSPAEVLLGLESSTFQFDCNAFTHYSPPWYIYIFTHFLFYLAKFECKIFHLNLASRVAEWFES